MNKDNIKPAEVSEVLLAELQGIDLKAQYAEVGTTLQVSDGVVRIHADVEAVRTSDEVGVSYITVQESDDGGKTWTTLKKYTKEELDMYEKDSGLYYGTFDFEDTVIGRDYRALVGVYAERNGGGDLRSVYTNEVTAKR
mgnify:CR=1 FL=1